MKLFDEMPYIADDQIELKEMTPDDAAALEIISKDPKVYVYLPKYLFEHKYNNASEVITRIREECFRTKMSVFLGIFRKNKPSVMTGIAEIYAYDEAKNKASIGYRLAREYWHQGIASRAALLLKNYLDQQIKIRTITAHVMTHNIASAKSLQSIGFEKRYPGLWEDWGREGPVLIDKYVYKNLNNKRDPE